jgi:hypothetical protein
MGQTIQHFAQMKAFRREGAHRVPSALSFQTEVNCNFSVFSKPILALKLTSSSVMPST